MQRTLYALPYLVCSVLFGCGGDDDFAAGYKTELRYDCEQTVACRGGRGDALTATPVEDCIEASSHELDGLSDRRRDIWVETFGRCAAFQGCDYYNCAKSDRAYSTAHAAEIQYDCASRIACRVSRGEMLASDVVDQCVAQTSAALDIAPEDMRIAFQTRFARCNTMQQCAYNDCQ